MVNNISWASYWSVLSVLIIIYYLYMLLVYYRQELQHRFQPIYQPKANLRQSRDQNDDSEVLPELQSLNDEMTAYLEQAGYEGAIREEIIFALQQIVKKYGILKEGEYRQAINSLVQLECENKCAIHLSEEEVETLWVS